MLKVIKLTLAETKLFLVALLTIKAESLEQIKKIASSLTNSEDGAVKKTVKTAMKLLRGSAAALPKGAAMVTICNQLPELIEKIFN